MNDASYETFEAAAKAAGFGEVLVREWAPDQVVGTHTHPFDVQARVVRGEFWLRCGDEVKHIPAGGGFELAREVPHDERYGAEGATVWVGRRR